MTPEGYMRRALTCAKKAAALGEVPVGAVIVRDGKVIASGYNKRESGKNALLHAEMIAIHRACRKLGGWRLEDCELYVTLEPCPMCTGAIINSRIGRVFIGAADPKAGCMGSLCDLPSLPFNHRPQVTFGVLESECSDLLSRFFRDLRIARKSQPKNVTLRSFTKEDVPLLKRYLYPKMTESALSELVDSWNTRLFEGRYLEFFAILAEDEPVGYVSLCEQPDGSVSAGAHVFSDYRGKTYGTQGVRALCRIASERGYSSLTARVRKTNTPSLRLCRTVGFVPVGEDVTAKGVPVVCFSLSLPDGKKN